MKICKSWYLKRILFVVILFLGIGGLIGCFTDYGIHVTPPITPKYVLVILNLILIISSSMCLIINKKANDTKYTKKFYFKSDQFKRNFFTNGIVLTLEDVDANYIWLINKGKNMRFEKKWFSKNDLITIKKHYNCAKKCVYVELII